jgi:hypothetical protein
MSNSIAKALNMQPYNTPEGVTHKIDEDIDLDADLEAARRDIKEIADIGIQAVAEVASLASQSQHDKLYMALSSVMKSTLEANRELIDTHRSRKELKAIAEIESGTTVNNLFIGTTAELQELLAGKKDD